MVYLPVEVLERIVDHLHDDTWTLGACALAGRELVHASRMHRFRTVEINNHARELTFFDLCAASGDFGSLIWNLRLVDNGFFSLMTRQRIRSPQAPQCGNLVSVELSGFILRDGLSAAVNALRMMHLPSAKQLRLSDCSYSTRAGSSTSLATTMTSLSSPIDVISTSNVTKQGWQTLVIFPPALHTLDLHWTGSCQLAAVRVQLRLLWWFIEHPAGEDVLSILRARMDLGRLLKGVLSDIGPAGPQHLELAMDWLASRRPDDLAPFPLSAYTGLQTFTLHFIISSNRWTEYSHLSDINALLGWLDSPSLTTITLAVHTSIMRDTQFPSVEARDVQWEELRALEWRDMERLLVQPKFAGLKKLVIYGGGDDSILRSHLQRVCPTLHGRGLIDLA